MARGLPGPTNRGRLRATVLQLAGGLLAVVLVLTVLTHYHFVHLPKSAHHLSAPERPASIAPTARFFGEQSPEGKWLDRHRKHLARERKKEKHRGGGGNGAMATVSGGLLPSKVTVRAVSSGRFVWRADGDGLIAGADAASVALTERSFQVVVVDAAQGFFALRSLSVDPSVGGRLACVGGSTLQLHLAPAPQGSGSSGWGGWGGGSGGGGARSLASLEEFEAMRNVHREPPAETAKPLSWAMRQRVDLVATKAKNAWAAEKAEAAKAAAWAAAAVANTTESAAAAWARVNAHAETTAAAPPAASLLAPGSLDRRACHFRFEPVASTGEPKAKAKGEGAAGDSRAGHLWNRGTGSYAALVANDPAAPFGTLRGKPHAVAASRAASTVASAASSLASSSASAYGEYKAYTSAPVVGPQWIGGAGIKGEVFALAPVTDDDLARDAVNEAAEARHAAEEEAKQVATLQRLFAQHPPPPTTRAGEEAGGKQERHQRPLDAAAFLVAPDDAVPPSLAAAQAPPEVVAGDAAWRREKRVISFGLYGSNPKYVAGALKNVRLQATYFPGWVCRFYVDGSVPASALAELKSLGAETVAMDGSSIVGGIAGMFWRFLVADDPTVDRFIVRDSDSRLNARDAMAVAEWTAGVPGAPRKKVHTVRDHVNHERPMNGGMWGAARGFLDGAPALLAKLKADQEALWGGGGSYSGSQWDYASQALGLDGGGGGEGYDDDAESGQGPYRRRLEAVGSGGVETGSGGSEGSGGSDAADAMLASLHYGGAEGIARGGARATQGLGDMRPHATPKLAEALARSSGHSSGGHSSGGHSSSGHSSGGQSSSDHSSSGISSEHGSGKEDIDAYREKALGAELDAYRAKVAAMGGAAGGTSGHRSGGHRSGGHRSGGRDASEGDSTGRPAVRLAGSDDDGLGLHPRLAGHASHGVGGVGHGVDGVDGKGGAAEHSQSRLRGPPYTGHRGGGDARGDEAQAARAAEAAAVAAEADAWASGAAVAKKAEGAAPGPPAAAALPAPVTMASLIGSYWNKDAYGADLSFLEQVVWPLVKDDALGHDAYSCEKFKGSIGFPTKRPRNFQHVGQVFDAWDQPRMTDIDGFIRGKEAPAACRRNPDWIYG